MPDTSSIPSTLPIRPRWRLMDYFWFLFNNIVGWLFILLAGPVGLTFPGPGGLPLFLIGFAMITLPGKRALTSRVMRGIPVNSNSRLYRWIAGVIAFSAPGMLFSWLSWFIYHDQRRWYLLSRDQWLDIWKQAPWQTLLFLVYLCLVTLIWIFAVHGAWIINLGLALVPYVRRKARPWMRRKGLDLLPPRRRKRLLQKGAPADEGILEIDPRYQHFAQRLWVRGRRRFKRRTHHHRHP
jgi:hypothetical protein